MSRPPNIVFLFPDQLRRDFLSCYGASFIDTPNIDWIADNGVRYDNAYSASPLCVPARTTLLTGMNAVKNGVTDNLHAIRPDYNDAGIRTWPQVLAAAGYYTSAVGKMHFYPWDARHGFQYRVVCEDKLWAYVRDDYYHYLKDRGLRKLPWHEYGDYVASRGTATTDVPWDHSWDRFTGREARRFIERHGSDGPFAMMVGFPGPHDPYDPAADFPHKFSAADMPDPVPAAGDPAGLVADHIRARQGMGMDLADWSDDQKKSARAHYARPRQADRPRGGRDHRHAARSGTCWTTPPSSSPPTTGTISETTGSTARPPSTTRRPTSPCIVRPPGGTDRQGRRPISSSCETSRPRCSGSPTRTCRTTWTPSRCRASV